MVKILNNRRILILDLLEILKENTDEDRKITQDKILEKLRERGYENITRGTVKNNIDRIIDAGCYDLIDYEEVETRDGWVILS